MPDGREILYFLTIESDIEEENLANEFVIKRITSQNWRDWFGVEITHRADGMNIKGVGRGPYSSMLGTTDQIGDFGTEIYSCNYVIFGPVEGLPAESVKFDRALRLFKPGKSGVHFGLSAARFVYFHPSPGWKELSISRLMKGDLPALLELSNFLSTITNEKALLLIDRYRTATQGGSEIRPHNRFVDLVTILEMIYVPDGRSGEISYKLRMRGSCILAEAFGVSKVVFLDKLKSLYNLRSRIVHDGDEAGVPDNAWVDLADYCRTSIVLYLRSTDSFSAANLDLKLLSK